MSLNFGDILKQLRQAKGMSQEEFASLLGTTKQVVSRYENGQRTPKITVAQKYAEVLGISLNELLGENVIEGQTIPDGFEPMPDMTCVPLVGRIACGEPITAEQNVEGVVSVPSQWRSDFALLCQGDSMEPSIKDGDLVAIHIQPMVENGEVAAVRIDNEATLKHVYLYPNYIELRPENPAYQSIIKIGEEMNEVKIEGKAVGLCRGM